MEGFVLTRYDTVVAVSDMTGVSEARRAVARVSEKIRLSETDAGKAALIATELSTNLVKHARGGSLVIGTNDGRLPGLALMSMDRGRGIDNLNQAMSDGYSTAGSPGNGLGAVERAASSLEIYTHPGLGTVIACTIGGGAVPAPVTRGAFDIAGICVPKHGETEAGDAWAAHVEPGGPATVIVADGLGHGPDAAVAAIAALRVFRERPTLSLDELFQLAHGALRATRGAAVSIARIDAAGTAVEFGGIGNVAGTIATPSASKKTVSYPGIVGHEMRKVQLFPYAWDASSVLIVHSDGVSTAWQLEKYPGLLQHGAAIIAAVLYRDFCRGRDDATVVVAKAA